MTTSRSLSWIDRDRWAGLLARVTDEPPAGSLPRPAARPIAPPRPAMRPTGTSPPARPAPPVLRSTAPSTTLRVAAAPPPPAPPPATAVVAAPAAPEPPRRAKSITSPLPTGRARQATGPMPVVPPPPAPPSPNGATAAPPSPPAAAAPPSPPSTVVAAPPPPPPKPAGYPPFVATARNLEERLQALVAWIEACVPCRAAFIADDNGLPVVEHVGAEADHVAAASSILLMLASVRSLTRDSGGWLSLKVGAQTLNVVEVATRWGRFGIGVVTDDALARDFLTQLSAAVERAFHGDPTTGEAT
jgi:hypothetical protein